MKKLSKRAVLIAVIFTLLVFPVSASEESEPESYFTGLIWDDRETIEDHFDFYLFAKSRPGDVDGDSKISSSDARLCLRACAQLEELTSIQHDSADVNQDGFVNSKDARLILRASAQIEILPDMKVDLLEEVPFTVGPLVSNSSTAYYWQAEFDEEIFNIKEYRITEEDTETGVIGNECSHFFMVNVKNEELLKTGDKKITFKLSNGSGKDVIDEFCVAINS